MARRRALDVVGLPLDMVLGGVHTTYLSRDFRLVIFLGLHPLTTGGIDILFRIPLGSTHTFFTFQEGHIDCCSCQHIQSQGPGPTAAGNWIPLLSVTLIEW